MSPDEIAQDELAAFQAALLELLSRPLSPAVMWDELRTAPEFAPFADYIAGFDLPMLEVAALLVKKWGRRDDHSDVGKMPH